MFNATKIATELYGLVGFRQPFNPTYAVLDAANQLSNSGLFVTDNPYCKIEYLKDTQDFKDASDAEFNTFLERLQKTSIQNVCNSIFSDADYIDRQVLYKNAMNKVDSEILPDGFVGFRIVVSQEKNIAFQIKRVILDFETTGTFSLLLFQTGDLNPIKQQSITITSNHEEFVLDEWVADNSLDLYKGDYYLGYIASAATPKPYKRDYQSADIESIITHLEIERIKVPGHATATLWDLELKEGLNQSTGLNPDFQVFDDFTDLIVQNQKLLSRAINLDIQIACLGHYLASLRSNRNQRKGDDMTVQLIQQLEGFKSDNGLKITGLGVKLSREIKSIKTEIEKLREGYFGGAIMTDTLN